MPSHRIAQLISPHRRIASLYVFALLSIAVGCDFIPPRPPIGDPPKRETIDLEDVNMATVIEAAEQSGGDPEAIARAVRSAKQKSKIGEIKPWETWEVYFQGQTPVGYAHIAAEAVDEWENAVENGKLVDEERVPEIRYTAKDQMTTQEGQATIVRYSSQSTFQNQANGLLEFESAYRSGAKRKAVRGRVNGGKLTLTSTTGSTAKSERLDWKENYLGFMGLRQSLLSKPMKSGERRTLRLLWPLQDQVATARLYCIGYASVPLYNGTSTVLEINCRVSVNDTPVSEMVMWTTSKGVIERMMFPALRIVSYRTDEAEVKKLIHPAPELKTLASVSVTGKIDRPAKVKRTAFEVQWLSPNAKHANNPPIVAMPCQELSPAKDGRWRVLSRCHEIKARPNMKRFVDAPVEADTEPTKLIDSTSGAVAQVVRSGVSPSVEDAREIALQLTESIGLLLTYGDYSAQLSKASSIPKKTRCDSVDYAILLAAALRSKGVPCRIAYGLRYLDDQNPTGDPIESRMKIHTWVVAWMDGQWKGLDAIDRGFAKPDRLTLGITNLQQDDLQENLAEATDRMGRIRIKILGASY